MSRPKLLLTIGLVLLIAVCRKSEEGEWSRGDRGLLRMALSPQWDQGVNVLVLGTSISWGDGLPPTQRSGAYPYLLSKTVKNAAAYKSKIEFAAACTQSLVGNKLYDVIVIEFSPEVNNNSFLKLAARLRQRFPRAVFIFLKLWDFRHVYTSSPTGALVTFETFKFQNAENVSVQSFAFRKVVSDWPQPFLYYHDEELDRKYHQAIGSVNGTIVTLLKPVQAKAALLEYGRWFNDDGQTLSLQGHAMIAQRILDKVKPINVTGLIQDYQTSGLEEWGEGDDCELWYTTGKVNYNYSSTMKLTLFDSVDHKQDHYAVEIEKQGTMTVLNPFGTARMLYLTYMATGPASIYPKAVVHWNGQEVVLDPLIPTTANGAAIHVPRTVPIGHVQPGETTLTFTVLSQNNAIPFRLTGVSLLAFDDLPIEFNLESGEATPFPLAPISNTFAVDS